MNENPLLLQNTKIPFWIDRYITHIQKKQKHCRLIKYFRKVNILVSFAAAFKAWSEYWWYKGEGWGLMQVLLAMEGKSVAAFARAAEKQLTRRTVNNPPDKRWLKGWINRVSKYPTALSGKG